MTARPFTGRHMAAIMVAFFSVIIAVNLFMARQASSTFGGVTVENTYVASQKYNRWLHEAAAERALGWQAAMRRASDGRVTIALTGLRDEPESVIATARHPLGQAPDRILHFARSGTDFVSSDVLPAGRWRIRLEVRADGKLWRTEGDVR